MEIASRIPYDSSYSSYEVVDLQLLTLWLVNGTSSSHRKQRRFLDTALCSLIAYPFQHARRGCIYSTSDAVCPSDHISYFRFLPWNLLT